MTTDTPTNLGIHLAAMSASLKQKDALRAARSAYYIMKGSWMGVHSVAMMVVRLDDGRPNDLLRAGYLEQH